MVYAGAQSVYKQWGICYIRIMLCIGYLYLQMHQFLDPAEEQQVVRQLEEYSRNGCVYAHICVLCVCVNERKSEHREYCARGRGIETKGECCSSYIWLWLCDVQFFLDNVSVCAGMSHPW